MTSAAIFQPLVHQRIPLVKVAFAGRARCVHYMLAEIAPVAAPLFNRCC